MAETQKSVRPGFATLSMEESRLEHRDRSVAMAVAKEVTEHHFIPNEIEGISDFRRMAVRIAEYAAYAAIQKEREFHAGDMAALEAWSKARFTEEMLKPRPVIVPGSIP